MMRKKLTHFALLWSLFFAICLGLGYPSLKRYDPRMVEGLSDSAFYYQMVASGPRTLDRPQMRGRVLVPFVAKPFYLLAKGRLHGTDPALFGLLIADSIFCATTALLLVLVAISITPDGAVALLAAALYLLNFAVTNMQLAGMIDSGEASFMLAITLALIHERWRLLPALAIFGALAKETFVPFATVFALVWWLVEKRNASDRFTKLGWVLVASVAGFVALILTNSVIAGRTVWPWEIAEGASERAIFFDALARCLLNAGTLYAFAWLLPLGVWLLKRLPRAWVAASVSTALVALLLCAWRDIGDNAARPLFNTLGPMLSLSAAMFMAEHFRGQTASKRL